MLQSDGLRMSQFDFSHSENAFKIHSMTQWNPSTKENNSPSKMDEQIENSSIGKGHATSF